MTERSKKRGRRIREGIENENEIKEERRWRDMGWKARDVERIIKKE